MRIRSAIAALFAAVAPLGAQQPPDTLAVPDSANVVVIPDTLLGRSAGDTIPDSLRFYILPQIDGGPPAGFANGIWEFDRDDILVARGLSLGDLLIDVPGMIRLRGGDYGAPETVTAFGLGGGEIRVFWDGLEQVPLDGSVVDLASVGLGGVERVRVERHPAELRIEITSQRDFDARPSSLVEAGTGDFDTNFFRGTFIHPRALGGGLGFSLDRVDTNGASSAHEDGARTGGWLRYTRHLGDDVAFTGEVRRMRANVDASGYPARGERGDWMVRGLWRPASTLILQGFTGGSSLDGLELTGRLPVDRSRRQHGALADFAQGPIRASGAFRSFGGEPLPSISLDLSATVDLPLIGGATGSFSRESWDGEDATLTRVTAWTRSVAGISLFGSRESGQRGAILYPLPSEVPSDPDSTAKPEPAPTHRLTDRTATRFGGTLAWRGLGISAARLELETDSLPLLGLPMDRDGIVLPGIQRNGYEVTGQVPLSFALDGLSLNGIFTTWNQDARYLPKRTYQGAFVFHDTFLPTGNLELWGTLGVEGRYPMLVPIGDPALGLPPEGEAAEPATVPFSQSWYALIQVRILQLRIFISWENFTIRRNNQDFPGRSLPIFRAHYGIRWYLWN